MKYILSFILLLSLNKASELSIGSMMPEMGHRMKNINGKNLTLSDAKGDVGTLVIFSCNTCPWVVKWEDRYVSITEAYSPKGIGVIAVNSNAARFSGDDSLEKMKKHSKKNKYNFPYVQDPGSKLAKAFGATKTPHIYLFDDKDRLVYRGAIDDNARSANSVEEQFLSNAIDELIAGKPISKETTRAIGCSIKFQ